MEESSNLRLYRRMTAKLVRMIADGQGDSEAADALRDEMDPVWMTLTKEEVAISNSWEDDYLMGLPEKS
jgi:hypothetical protein